jgi:MFS family permease
LDCGPYCWFALVVQAATMWVFATADAVPNLLAARVIQGLATGAALAAVGAGMLDIDRERGTVANAVAPMAGTAIGGLLAGIFVQVSARAKPAGLHHAVGSRSWCRRSVSVMPEDDGRLGRAPWHRLRPAFALPPAARRPMLTATPVIVAAWGLAGLYLSVGPALARQTVHSGSILVGGVVVFIMAGAASVTVLVARKLAAVRMMTNGIVTLIVGVALS